MDDGSNDAVASYLPYSFVTLAILFLPGFGAGFFLDFGEAKSLLIRSWFALYRFSVSV
jgi:hypothetical protein